MSTTQRIENYVGGAWSAVKGAEQLAVVNPATAETLGRVPLSPAAEVDRAVKAAAAAYPAWRRTPAGERVQYLFKLKGLIEAHLDDLARTLTEECGKTLAESAAEWRRAIENVEVACGMPSLMQGYNSEDIASGIDEIMIRQPLGVVAAITPFNFPGMVPLWFLPYAIACGNCFILKPSEKVPLSAVRLCELLAETGLPAGVVNLVHGGKAAVDALLDHPGIRAISFVGSSAVAQYVYARGCASGKRVQCQGGAKNPVLLLPDADPEMTRKVLIDSAFGCAGQRCLAASLVYTVGKAHELFIPELAEAARTRVVGNGLDSGVETGPVITPESKAPMQGLIESGL